MEKRFSERMEKIEEKWLVVSSIRTEKKQGFVDEL